MDDKEGQSQEDIVYMVNEEEAELEWINLENYLVNSGWLYGYKVNIFLSKIYPNKLYALGWLEELRKKCVFYIKIVDLDRRLDAHLVGFEVDLKNTR